MAKLTKIIKNAVDKKLNIDSLQIYEDKNGVCKVEILYRKNTGNLCIIKKRYKIVDFDVVSEKIFDADKISICNKNLHMYTAYCSNFYINVYSDNSNHNKLLDKNQYYKFGRFN